MNTFVSEKQYQDSVRESSKAGGQKDFSCVKCPKIYSSRVGLQNHLILAFNTGKGQVFPDSHRIKGGAKGARGPWDAS